MCPRKIHRRKNIRMAVNLLKAPLPPQKSRFLKEKSKLSFYHRKMHRSLLFQNIYGFSENGQILMDLLAEIWAYYHVFREIFVIFSIFSVVLKTAFPFASPMNREFFILIILINQKIDKNMRAT